MTEPTVTTTTELPYEERLKKLKDGAVPYFGVCTNDTKVILDPKKIYGYYKRTIFVENPINNISVSNNVWLRHGDLCRLTIKFTGTAPFNYCTKISSNDNSSVEVTQDSDDCFGWKPSDVNEINYGHFFSKDSNSYSLVVYIKNEVSLTRTPIGVQFYEGMESVFLYEIFIKIFFTFSPRAFAIVGRDSTGCFLSSSSSSDCFWRCILCSESKPIHDRGCRFQLWGDTVDRLTGVQVLLPASS